MSFETWTSAKLDKFGYQDPNELTTYLISFSESSEVQDCLTAILDTENPEHLEFLNQFMSKYKEMKESQKPGYYRKSDINEDNQRETLSADKDSEKLSPSSSTTKNQPQSFSSKKKSKFVSIYSEEGRSKDTILLPGRHKCECQASKHKLINNCLSCGRIICEQEGSGPCSFCNFLVVSKEEKEIINKGSKKSNALQNKLLNTQKVMDGEAEKKKKNNNSIPESLSKAMEHKNKLLEYDRTSEKRTKVFDDESDYFQSSSKWINPSDREKLRKYEEELKIKKYDRSMRTYTVDLLGRKIYTNVPQNFEDPNNDPILQELLNRNDQESEGYLKAFEGLNISRPSFIESGNRKINEKNQMTNISSDFSRIQDKELQLMTDDGVCLSMHQPWASLLIAGIKKHEGRDWYHSHRGRLWIASAAKTPTPADISSVEQYYRDFYKNERLKFPKNYPTSCLLGCVDVVDILPQEEYRLGFHGQGESECPYVFVCENPLEMSVKFPIKGQHKIYKLEKKIHQTALKSLKLR